MRILQTVGQKESESSVSCIPYTWCFCKMYFGALLLRSCGINALQSMHKCLVTAADQSCQSLLVQIILFNKCLVWGGCRGSLSKELTDASPLTVT